MSRIVREAAGLLEILPEEDQMFACQFIKKLVLAWDPDFTKLTDAEARSLAEAEESGFIDERDVDWEHLDQY